MIKNKTAIFVILSVLGFSLLLYFVPLGKILSKLPLINKIYNNTTLEIVTQNAKATIKINGKEYGETPSKIENLPEGTYDVELEKIEEKKSFYKKHNFQITLTKNTVARIDIEIGPETSLQGSILYYTPSKTSSKEGFLTVTTNTEDAKIYIDKEFAKRAPVSNISLKDSQYEVKVTATGFESVELPIYIRSGYQLNLKTYHFPIPTSFDILKDTDE